MSSKRRDKIRDLKQRQALWDHYGDRVVRSGELKPKHEYSRFYCFGCGNHFLQKTASLVDRGCTTRCMCEPHDSKRFTNGQHPKSHGHMCLPEWDQWDLEKPDRPTCRPE